MADTPILGIVNLILILVLTVIIIIFFIYYKSHRDQIASQGIAYDIVQATLQGTTGTIEADPNTLYNIASGVSVLYITKPDNIVSGTRFIIQNNNNNTNLTVIGTTSAAGMSSSVVGIAGGVLQSGSTSALVPAGIVSEFMWISDSPGVALQLYPD